MTKKIKLEISIDLKFIFPKIKPIPLIRINDKYTNKLINEIPSIKSDMIRHIKGIAKPIYLFLKLIIENKATAVIGVKFGG